MTNCRPTPARIGATRCGAVGGFTITELLVVLAVMSILGTLLASALNRTKGRAHEISCLGNLRQLQVSWFMYSDENNDQLPENRSVGSPNEKIFGRRNTTNSWVAGNPKEDVTAESIQRGTLFPYTKASDLYRCSADQSQVIGRNVRRTRSYSMSSYLYGDRAGLDARVKTTFGSLVNPSLDKLFVFIEEHEASPWIGSFSVPTKERLAVAASSWESVPSDRHRGGCNLSFADGHAEYWKWYSSKTADLISKPVLTSQEMRDLRRLQESIPQ